jgi:hypothetical protein
MTTRILAAALFVSTALLAAPPRIALLYSDHGNFRHRDDYDRVIKHLGWPMTKFENRQIGDLVKRLDEFDILLGSALFNYANPQPLGTYKSELLGFVAKGGAIVLTDVNYPQHVSWLRDFGNDWVVELVPQDGKTFPSSWQDVGHVLYALPKRTTLGGTWMGLKPGPVWDVLGKGKDGAATALYHPYGKGFFYLSCQWPHHENMLRNIWQCLQFHWDGAVPHFPAARTLELGASKLVFSLRNTAEEPQTLGIEAHFRQTGQNQTQTRTERVKPGGQVICTLPLTVTRRGAYAVDATFTAGNRKVWSGTVLEGVIPALLTTQFRHPYPRTKPLLYAEAMPKKLVLHSRFHPAPGQDLGALAMELRLVDARGELSRGGRNPVADAEFDTTLALPRIPVAPLRIEQTVRQGKTVLQNDRIAVEIVPPYRPSVIVDDRLVLQVNGKPFFPIGAYHVANKDLPKARRLGFNCLQAWGSTLPQAKENLDAARKNDMMVLLELSSFLRNKFRPNELCDMIDQFKTHPALLTWYTIDEPNGDLQHDWAQQAFADIVARDPYHPIYLVMCAPGSFDRFGATTDILAVDPYPIPKSVRMVTSWMERAQNAVQGCKPIWMIPQLHNWSAYRKQKGGRAPTPTELRNMVYQSLVWGAKGVIYYPWDDKVTGLIYEPKLMDNIGPLNRELAELGPQLLAATRTMLATGKETPCVAATFRLENRTLVLAANLTKQPASVVVSAAGTAAAPLYASPPAKLDGDSLKAQLPALGVGVWEIR